MIVTKASRLLILPTRGNLCPIIQSESMPGVACPAALRGSEVGANRSVRNAPGGNAEQHHLRRCDDALAYDLPKAWRFKSAPGWIDLVRVYAQPVIALMISFVVAGCSGSAITGGSPWRRKAAAAWYSSICFFCLSIIILPVTNGLYGSYRLDSVVAVVYGVHLTHRQLNALLWILALRARRNSGLLVIAVFPVFALLFATVMAAVAPFVAQFMWCLAFAAPLAGWLAARHWPPKNGLVRSILPKLPRSQ